MHPEYIIKPEQNAKLQDWASRLDAAIGENTCHRPRLIRLRGYVASCQRTNAHDLAATFIWEYGAAIESELRGVAMAVADRAERLAA